MGSGIFLGEGVFDKNVLKFMVHDTEYSKNHCIVQIKLMNFMACVSIKL